MFKNFFVAQALRYGFQETFKQFKLFFPWLAFSGLVFSGAVFVTGYMYGVPIDWMLEYVRFIIRIEWFGFGPLYQWPTSVGLLYEHKEQFSTVYYIFTACMYVVAYLYIIRLELGLITMGFDLYDKDMSFLMQQTCQLMHVLCARLLSFLSTIIFLLVLGGLIELLFACFGASEKLFYWQALTGFYGFIAIVYAWMGVPVVFNYFLIPGVIAPWFLFVSHYTIDKKVNGGRALLMSCALARKNFLEVAVYVIIINALLALGAFIYIGWLVTWPLFCFSSVYLYRRLESVVSV